MKFTEQQELIGTKIKVKIIMLGEFNSDEVRYIISLDLTDPTESSKYFTVWQYNPPPTYKYQVISQLNSNLFAKQTIEFNRNT